MRFFWGLWLLTRGCGPERSFLDENGVVGQLLVPVALQDLVPLSGALAHPIIRWEVIRSIFPRPGWPISYFSFLIKMEIHPASFLMVWFLNGRVQLYP